MTLRPEVNTYRLKLRPRPSVFLKSIIQYIVADASSPVAVTFLALGKPDRSQPCPQGAHILLGEMGYEHTCDVTERQK